MAQTKGQLAGKLLKGAVKKTVAANMQLWGGNKVPYLRGAVNAAMSLLDFDKIWQELKVEPSTRSKIKTNRAAIIKATNEIAQRNHTLGTMKTTICTITSELRYLQVTAQAYAGSGGAAWGPNIIYRVNESVLRKLNLHGAISTTSFKALNKGVVPANVLADYNAKIKALRDMESKVMMELNRLAQAEQQLKRSQKALDDIVRNQNNNRR